MNAPCPPPTMPSRSLRRVPAFAWLLSLTMPAVPAPASAIEPEGVAHGRLVRPLVDERLERGLADLDDVPRDELRALARAVDAVLERALPFQHRPAAVAVGGEAGEHRPEVDVAVA